MAGGTANKGSALLSVALARMVEAEKVIQQLAQTGSPSTDSRHVQADPAIAAAIVALQALV